VGSPRWPRLGVPLFVILGLAAIPLACGTRVFVVEAFNVPGESMAPTLLAGDHIAVSKSAFGAAIPFTHARLWASPPKRGEVVVFAFPEHPDQDFVKRAVALPGDTLSTRSGHPYLDGWPIPSCHLGRWSYDDSGSPPHHEGDLFVEFLGDESYLTFYDEFLGVFPENLGPWVVKAGEFWVLGDNRNSSHDSRMWYQGRGGGVPFDLARGRALFVWWSESPSRSGVAVRKPTLPDSAASLQGALDTCLKQRPAQTTPPPQKISGTSAP
jgi:signal peptidase I